MIGDDPLPRDARILAALRAQEAIPLTELATEAGVTLAELGEAIAALQQAGYGIELVPHQGYRLFSSPDRIVADDLFSRLGVRLRLAREITVFEETGSTNDVAAGMARSGAREGLVIFAERQSAGRGRFGRRWDSAAHLGLWFSVLVRPRLELSDWSRLTTWAAVGVARGLEKVAPGRSVRIKWPNDLLIDGRKIVGILIEGSAEPGGYAIVGIGINVNQSEFPPELGGKAGSLRGDGPMMDRQAVAAAVLQELDARYGSLSDGFPSILAEAEARSVLRGEWITVHTLGGQVEGMAEGLEPDGRLRIRLRSGEVLALSGGEVSLGVL